ncbi:hypothetical protein PI172_1293 [Prevotella intermedia]|uniref:Uncharacterized protein n=1 Tax=Prevotella intermedia TaxID=28131 RepID=A0AAD1F7K0_PREIN|nr:hypothetical protein PI172_1293 [Prevotella intermedia]
MLRFIFAITTSNFSLKSLITCLLPSFTSRTTLLVAAFSIVFLTLHSSMSYPQTFLAPHLPATIDKIPVPQPQSNTFFPFKSIPNNCATIICVVSCVPEPKACLGSILIIKGLLPSAFSINACGFSSFTLQITQLSLMIIGANPAFSHSSFQFLSSAFSTLYSIFVSGRIKLEMPSFNVCSSKTSSRQYPFTISSSSENESQPASPAIATKSSRTNSVSGLTLNVICRYFITICFYILQMYK